MSAGPADRLAEVRARIDAACAHAGRSASEVTLIAVSKGMPAHHVAQILALGVADVGENKAQEAAAKALTIAGLDTELSPRWHFLGQLQRNKARLVVEFAAMVHSVDRAALVGILDRAAADRPHALDVLVQVDLDPDPTPARGGIGPSDVPALAEAVLGTRNLTLRGIMTVAPSGVDPTRTFDRLFEVSESLQALAPGAGVISAGMSGDLEAAISAGTTHVRVGTALFGPRKLASDHWDRAGG